jgi:hypothetical protein
LKITFTKTGERECATRALRDDGVMVRVPAFDRPAMIPHDLAHCIVERELGIQGGFWGCVARGALFSGMAIEGGRQPARAADRSRKVLRGAGQQGTEAEVVVGILVDLLRDGLENNRAALVDHLRRMWRPARPSWELPGEEQVLKVCRLLREATARWQNLAIGESITETWHLGLHAARRRSAVLRDGSRRGSRVVR